jgi:L-ascorbate metabolism protein UlaG (beta-lactamase superfamily)
VKLTWLGHSTVVIDTDDGRLVTDPVLRSRVAHLRRHASAAAVPERVDATLLSHLHHDHLDVPSLRSVGAKVVGPPGTSRTLRRLGLAVLELAPGDAVELAGAQVTAVAAVHDGRRWPVGKPREDDAIGFVVAAGGQRVYFAGDTELFDDMRKLGPLDVALVPIWGWGTSLGPGHMNPSEAAAALALLAPATVVPIHWGTYLPIGSHRRHGRLLRTPVDEFLEEAARLAPRVHVQVLAPGESLVVPAPRSAG